MAKRAGWLRRKAPGLHRFLTRRDRPWPLVREGLAALLVLGLLMGALYGLTGQPLRGGYPVVVITTGSMMHCEGDGDQRVFERLGKDCTPTHWGRLGTIDPGDLVFVRAVDEPADIATAAEGDSSHYSGQGDVIVFRPNGDATRTPIIHRALFWVQVEADGTLSVPALGIERARDLDTQAVRDLTGGCDPSSAFQVASHPAGAKASGFVTRGDNNGVADQCAGSGIPPARIQDILGKARGEVPWIGLVNLLWGQWTAAPPNGCPHGCFTDAGGDSKVMFFVVVAVLVATPWLVEYGMRRRQRRRGAREDAEDDGEA